MQWDAFANRSPNGEFLHIGEAWWVKLHACGEVHPVTVIEDPEGGYWGWRKKDEPDSKMPSMIWPDRRLLSMCFAYGVDADIERGFGSIVRMRIEPRTRRPAAAGGIE
jgi:hypothetical protein